VYTLEQEPEVVLLSHVMSHKCNIGYETNRNLRLLRLNGETVRSLSHLAALVRGCGGANSLVFEFSTGQIMVLDAAAAERAQEQVVAEHFMPSHCSPDLVE
jgi:hypothetical protein